MEDFRPPDLLSPNPPESRQTRNFQRMPESAPPLLFLARPVRLSQEKFLRPFISGSVVQRPVWVSLQRYLASPQASFVAFYLTLCYLDNPSLPETVLEMQVRNKRQGESPINNFLVF